MTASKDEIEERIGRLHDSGLVDLHFDLLMELYEKRDKANLLATEFLPEFEAGNIGLLGAAIYIEDRYVPEMALRVALDQIALLHAEVEASNRFSICKSHQEILRAREAETDWSAYYNGRSRTTRHRSKSIAGFFPARSEGDRA
jgi:hypothetical protein